MGIIIQQVRQGRSLRARVWRVGWMSRVTEEPLGTVTLPATASLLGGRYHNPHFTDVQH